MSLRTRSTKSTTERTTRGSVYYVHGRPDGVGTGSRTVCHPDRRVNSLLSSDSRPSVPLLLLLPVRSCDPLNPLVGGGGVEDRPRGGPSTPVPLRVSSFVPLTSAGGPCTSTRHGRSFSGDTDERVGEGPGPWTSRERNPVTQRRLQGRGCVVGSGGSRRGEGPDLLKQGQSPCRLRQGRGLVEAPRPEDGDGNLVGDSGCVEGRVQDGGFPGSHPRGRTGYHLSTSNPQSVRLGRI